MLSVPASWVYRATREGHLPTVHVGRYYRYRMAAVAAWIASMER
jgi:excisionase family DNA binding protein